MAKLDLSNCFWSLRLPRSWVREFRVCVGDAPICLAVPAIWLEILTPPVSKVGVQCGLDVPVVATCTVFCLARTTF